MKQGLSACGKRTYRRRSALPKRPHHLFFEDLFNLADLPLELASDLFTVAVRLQARIVDDLASLLFYFSFSLVKFAFQLVFRTLFP